MPAFDSYLNYPAGANIPWSFLQEFLTVTIRRLFFAPGTGNLETLCFWYPAVVGSLSLALVYLLGRLFGLSRVASGIAAVFVSLSPAQIAYTTAGRFDHNSGDVFFATLFSSPFSRSGEKEQTRVVPPGGWLPCAAWPWPAPCCS